MFSHCSHTLTASVVLFTVVFNLNFICFYISHLHVLFLFPPNIIGAYIVAAVTGVITCEIVVSMNHLSCYYYCFRFWSKWMSPHVAVIGSSNRTTSLLINVDHCQNGNPFIAVIGPSQNCCHLIAVIDPSQKGCHFIAVIGSSQNCCPFIADMFSLQLQLYDVLPRPRNTVMYASSYPCPSTSWFDLCSS